MSEQENIQEITTAGLPQLLFRYEDLRRRLREVVSFSVIKDTSTVFGWTALMPSRTPRVDFSAWAFLIVIDVHF
jgi:hypothetical protein